MSSLARLAMPMTRLKSTALVALVCAAGGCRESSPTEQQLVGSVHIHFTTVGSDLDPDGYTIQLGDLSARSIPDSGVIEYLDVSTGEHRITLGGIAANCLVVGALPLVEVTAGDTTSASIEVSCDALLGAARISASTTGEDLDLDGYAITIDGRDVASRLPRTGSVVLDDIPHGTHTFGVSGIAGNCTPTGQADVTAAIQHGDTAAVTFSITCIHTPKIVFSGPRMINPDGTGNYALIPYYPAFNPVWSPDGKQIAATNPNRDGIYLFSAEDAAPRGLNVPKASDPAWSQDGTTLAIMIRPAIDSSYIAIYTFADSTVRPVTSGLFRDQQPAWSPDGTRIVFVREIRPTSVRMLFIINVDGTGLTQLTSGGNDQAPAWSPDGSLIAYTESGGMVDVIHADGTARVQLSAALMRLHPAWLTATTLLGLDNSGNLNFVDIGSKQVIYSIPLRAYAPDVVDFSWRP